MKKSIQGKLLFYMMVNILVFALLLLGSNYFFARSYHVNSKKNMLIEAGQKINQLVGQHHAVELYDSEMQLAINRLERNLGASITIGDPKGLIYFPMVEDLSRKKAPFKLNPFLQQDPMNNSGQLTLEGDSDNNQQVIYDWEEYNNDSIFVQVADPNLGIDTLRYQTPLNNGLLLMIWVPMSEISNSISLTNRFTSIIGIITIIITGIWSFIISKRFTKPIKDMNTIAKEISSLNFSQVMVVKGEDEIAQLSTTINDLSRKLNNTITELNTKNQQLEEDIDRERSLDKMRKEFISNVSHELKTPIFLIQGYAEGLKSNIANNNDRRDFYTNVIIEESEKMDIIVRDLLDLAQMESSSFSVNQCTFNICELMQDILQKIEPIFIEKDIQLNLELNDCFNVHGDPVRIEQVIVNYINNAVNHVDSYKEIRLSITKTSKKVRVSVYNTGEHIPDEAMDKIWTSFYKVDQARTREYGGTGLGLSIVKSIQDAHHNAYGVLNIDKGVEFWFELDLV